MLIGIGIGLGRASIDPSAAILGLFANGEQGAWYDPSDLTTLYQDRDGISAVTAVEQSVGLMLDKRKGPTPGAESFPGFASATAFNANGTISIGANSVTATCTVAGLFGINWSSLAGVVGQSYDMLVTISANASSGKAVQLDFAGRSTSLGTAVATVTRKYIDGISVQQLIIYIIGGAIGDTFTISAVSVKTLEGNHATQATAGARPVVKSGNYVLLDGTDDSIATAAGGGASTYALIVMGFQLAALGAARTLFSDRTGNTGLKLEVTAANAIVLSGGNGTTINTATGNAVAATTNYVVTAIYDGTNLSVQLNSAAAVTAACVLSAGTAAVSLGKDNGAASGFLSGRIYAMVYVKNDVQTTAQIAAAQQYVAGKSGVVL